MKHFFKFCALAFGKVLDWFCSAIIPIVFDYILRDDIINFINLIKSLIGM